jgi:hypothetical protein
MTKQQLGINLNDLNKLATANPKYATLLGELAGIDKLIKQFASDTVTNYADPNVYFIKTELLNQCYNLYLYNAERNVTVGKSWLFDDFLNKCQSKMIENEIENAVLNIIDKVNNDSKLNETKINWII